MRVRVLVTGGRDHTNRARIFKVLDRFHKKRGPITLIIHGACPTGADASADAWALSRRVSVIRRPADWKKYGKAAGMIRNLGMLKNDKPDVVIAFPGGTGTQNMVDLSKERGFTVYEIDRPATEPVEQTTLPL